MVPYENLLSIEQAIVDWKIEHPVMQVAFVVLLFVISYVLYKRLRKIEQERMRAERAEKRAWIKANKGL